MQDNKNVILLDIYPSLHDSNFLNAESLETVKGPENWWWNLLFPGVLTKPYWLEVINIQAAFISLQLRGGFSLQLSLVQIHFLQQVQNEKESFDTKWNYLHTS